MCGIQLISNVQQQLFGLLDIYLICSVSSAMGVYYNTKQHSDLSGANSPVHHLPELQIMRQTTVF